MEGITRILRKFIYITVLICFILFLLNFIILGIFVFKGSSRGQSPEEVVQNIEAELDYKDTDYVLGDKAKKMLVDNNAWAMLIDVRGKVRWNYNLPQEIPLTYNLIDIAKFSRNYLLDYPVFIWEHNDGLVVIGYPKNSLARYSVYYPINWIRRLPIRIFILFIVNVLLALFISILMGVRVTKSVKPLIVGIHALANEESTFVDTKGIFCELAKSINRTSNMLQDKNTALKSRDEARSNWIAGVSHDIRTPLSMVLGYSSELEENEVLPKEQREQASIIRKQGEKLKSLISDLNLVSMLEYEMQPLNLKTIRLSTLARQVASEFLNNGLDERFTINLDIPIEHIKVQADEKLLFRAINNLVQNSITHNPDGCEILLKTCILSDETTCCFIVGDNGTGISQDVLLHLKELPYSLSKNNITNNGHGLGIPMVARIIKAHKGQFLLESSVGKGVNAVIKLPLT
ncbi:HAMP domain-containing sensor histidine kinase [Clostridium sediminicola]|uniref:HAMP domain-containing sensor histidine kinase n=1 Tax=Clostridium sediminicola TaxID=3114879 RepID=UPI0031F20505